MIINLFSLPLNINKKSNVVFSHNKKSNVFSQNLDQIIFTVDLERIRCNISFGHNQRKNKKQNYHSLIMHVSRDGSVWGWVWLLPHQHSLYFLIYVLYFNIRQHIKCSSSGLEELDKPGCPKKKNRPTKNSISDPPCMLVYKNQNEYQIKQKF